MQTFRVVVGLSMSERVIPSFDEFCKLDHSQFAQMLAGETKIPEDDGDPLLGKAIAAILSVMAPMGQPDDMPIEELPIFKTEHFDEIPRDHIDAAYGERITQVALVRAVKAVRGVYRGTR